MEAVEAVLARAADAAKGVVQDRHLCVLVNLDVRNAFNSAPWNQIDSTVAGFGLPGYVRSLIWSYLSDRCILVAEGEAVRVMPMTCGVPQGLVLGPTLWNLFYDGLLRQRLPEGVSVVGFADDVALVTVNHTTEGIEGVLNEALATINSWLSNHGLELAHSKSEAVVLTRKWAYRQPVLQSGGVVIPVAHAVKYLGVTLDSKLTFTRHVRVVAASAAASARTIDRLMPNVGGPSVEKRRLLASVVSNPLLYAAPVWSAAASKYEVNSAALTGAQRLAA